MLTAFLNSTLLNGGLVVFKYKKIDPPDLGNQYLLLIGSLSTNIRSIAGMKFPDQSTSPFRSARVACSFDKNAGKRNFSILGFPFCQ